MKSPEKESYTNEMSKKHKPKQPGPKPETFKAEGVDWKDAIRHALGKKKPEKGQ